MESAGFVAVIEHVPVPVCMVTKPLVEFTVQIDAFADENVTFPVPLPPLLPTVTDPRYANVAGAPVTDKADCVNFDAEMFTVADAAA